MSGWSDLPADILEEICKRLDVVGFLRFGAVCVDWHRATKYCSTPLTRSQCGPKSRLPWLLLTSPDKPDSRYLYSLAERKAHEIHLPDIAGHRFIGSSHGFLISVDAEANIHATNPLTGVRLPLPPTSTFPCIRGPLRDNPSSRRLLAYLFEEPYRPNSFYFVSINGIRNYLQYSKAILSPSADAVAVVSDGFEWLAFARPGDESWASHYSDDRPEEFNFQDAIFHKGRLHAICYRGTLVLFDPEPPSRVPFFFTYPGPEPICFLSRDMSKRYLVESPDGESLFLLKRITEVDADDVVRTTDIKVSILIERTWTPVKEIGDIAIFLGLNYSTSVSAREYPCIKGNHVYLTQDQEEWLLGYREKAAGFGVEVFNLEDGSIEALYSDEDVVKLNGSPPLWFMPTL